MYKGFISYSHHDKKLAKRLHRGLELYRLPKKDGTASRRLGKFFRDDDDLGAASSLAKTVLEALQSSEYLIVICSPHSAKSKWVEAEINHFRQSGRSEKVLAVIVDGQPNSLDPEVESLPKPFRRIDEDGHMPLEPLAVDLRGNGFNRTVSKLAAAIAELPFDVLWNRARRQRSLRNFGFGLVATCMVGLVAVAGLTMARNEAQRQLNAEEQRVRTSEALREISFQSRLFAAQAAREDDPIEAALIALEAWSAPDPRENAALSVYGSLDPPTRAMRLQADWAIAGLAEPDRSAASAIVRRGLSNSREVWSRRFQNGFHELALSPDGQILMHSTEDRDLRIHWLDGSRADIVLQGNGYVHDASFDMERSRVVIAATFALFEVDLETGATRDIRFFDADNEIWDASINLGLDYTLVQLQNGSVLSIRLRDGAAVPFDAQGTHTEFAWNGDTALVANNTGLYAYDVVSGRGQLNYKADLRGLYRSETQGNNYLAMINAEDEVIFSDFDLKKRLTLTIPEVARSTRRDIAYDRQTQRVFMHAGRNQIFAKSFDNEQVERLTCHRNIQDIAIDTEARIIAAATLEGEICMWSLDDLSRRPGFETGAEIQNFLLRGDQFIFSDKTGRIRAWQWEQQTEVQRLETCPEHVSSIIFSLQDDALIAGGGLMGMCVWDMRTDPPALRHAPNLSFNFANGVPILSEAPHMLLSDRFGSVFEVKTPELTSVRRLPLPTGFIARSAHYAGLNGVIVVQSIDDEVIVFNQDNPPLTLQGTFTQLTVRFGAISDNHIVLSDTDGRLLFFDLTSGEQASSVELEASVTGVAFDPTINLWLIAQESPKRAFAFQPEALRLFPDQLRDLADQEGVTLFDRASLHGDFTNDVLIEAIEGNMVFIDTKTVSRIYTLRPEAVGALRIRSVAAQHGRLAKNRKVAVMAVDEIAGRPWVGLAQVPEILSQYHHPNAAGELDATDGEASLQVLRFWDREAEERLFRKATQSMTRCLSPAERARLQLSLDPPCWCATKSYPSQAVWNEALGRNPFTQARSNGEVCRADELKPWEASDVIP